MKGDWLNKHTHENQTDHGAKFTKEEGRSYQSEGEVERGSLLLCQTQGSTAGFT